MLGANDVLLKVKELFQVLFWILKDMKFMHNASLQNSQRAVFSWKIVLTIIVLIFFSYFFFDIPCAIFSHAHHLNKLYIFHVIVYIHHIIMWISLFGIFLWLFIRNNYEKYSLRILSCSLSVALAEFFIEVLKLFFGRYWIATYINNNISLLVNNVYGFKWFDGGLENSSFPSGNIALISAFMIMLSNYYPRYRLAFLSFIVVDMITIFGLNYHFISDMLGGILVGYISSFIITKVVWE